jgi:cystathionine beta-synthase
MKENIKAFIIMFWNSLGNTPLIKLNRITGKPKKGNFYAKVEAFNPGHSSKDRIAFTYNRRSREKKVFFPGHNHRKPLLVIPDLV